MSSTKSWKTPTAEEVRRTVALLGQPAQARYFFDRLENPEWLQPLRDIGVFRHPPTSFAEDDEGRRSHPVWPQSRYLVRMASERPHLVRDTFLEMTATDNVVLHEDIVAAALNMPPEVAASLVPLILEQVRAQPPLFSTKLAELMVHLASGDQERPALSLATLILTPIAKRKEPVRLGEELVDLGSTMEPRIMEYEYEEVLRTHFPALLDHLGISALQTLAGILESTVSQAVGGRDRSPNDYSEIWRPGVEDRPENIGSEVKSSLAAGLRDASVRLIRNRPTDLRLIVSALEARPWHIFHRIALHLCRTFLDLPDGRALAEERLHERRLFDSSWARNEYVQLLAAAFGHLSPEQQEHILSWIDAGPDLDAVRRSHQEWTGQTLTEVEVEHYRKSWQRDHLQVMAKHLKDRRAAYLQTLLGELGAPVALDASSRVFTWVGPTSPLTADQIRRMPIADLSAFLRRWQPGGGHFEPTPEGLGRILAAVVTEDPRPFVTESRLFQDIDATYIRAIFRGFTDAVEDGRELNWAGALELANWALEQPREIPHRETGGRDADPHWGWCWQAIANLLNSALRKDRIPPDIRVIVWNILERLTHDSDPTVEEDRAAGMDPATRSTNTVRGEAMHAVISYALWLRRQAEAAGAAETIASSFGSMPEVRRVLEERLDVTIEQSRAIRAVYGQWFPWLVLLDDTWAQQWAHVIFPPEENLRHLWEASWRTYLVFCAPYDSVFRVLREQYRLGVEAIGFASPSDSSDRDPDSQLAEHLMVFFARNVIQINDPIFRRFWELAPPKLAAHALGSIGRTLSRDKEPIPVAVLDRLTDLWNRRRQVIAESGERRAEEAAAFGWWFASNKFDLGWALRELNEALRIAGAVRVDFKVIEQLASAARAYPREVVDAVDAFIEGEEPWKIRGWRDELRSIFVEALRSGDEATREKTRQIINRLGTRAYFDFRDLLGR